MRHKSLTIDKGMDMFFDLPGSFKVKQTLFWVLSGLFVISTAAYDLYFTGVQKFSS